MGSMGRRRGRRTRSDDGGRRVDLEDGFPTFRHNQWTIEGEIERLGTFARGASRAAGWRRWVARAVALSIVAPFVIFLAVEVVSLLR
jgi:hypothetical protein